MRVVPDQPPLVHAAMVLADYALELRAQGRRAEAAEKVFEETPNGHARSYTMALLAYRRHEEMLLRFDELAAAYADLKVADLAARSKPSREGAL